MSHPKIERPSQKLRKKTAAEDNIKGREHGFQKFARLAPHRPHPNRPPWRGASPGALQQHGLNRRKGSRK
jgi:hypothetical protein